MMNNSAVGKKVTRILEFMSVFLTLLRNAVNSTCIPFIANEQQPNLCLTGSYVFVLFFLFE